MCRFRGDMALSGLTTAALSATCDCVGDVCRGRLRKQHGGRHDSVCLGPGDSLGHRVAATTLPTLLGVLAATTAMHARECRRQILPYRNRQVQSDSRRQVSQARYDHSEPRGTAKHVTANSPGRTHGGHNTRRDVGGRRQSRFPPILTAPPTVGNDLQTSHRIWFSCNGTSRNCLC
jgi:hypothetical protein